MTGNHIFRQKSCKWRLRKHSNIADIETFNDQRYFCSCHHCAFDFCRVARHFVFVIKIFSCLPFFSFIYSILTILSSTWIYCFCSYFSWCLWATRNHNFPHWIPIWRTKLSFWSWFFCALSTSIHRPNEHLFWLAACELRSFWQASSTHFRGWLLCSELQK